MAGDCLNVGKGHRLPYMAYNDSCWNAYFVRAVAKVFLYQQQNLKEAFEMSKATPFTELSPHHCAQRFNLVKHSKKHLHHGDINESMLTYYQKYFATV